MTPPGNGDARKELSKIFWNIVLAAATTSELLVYLGLHQLLEWVFNSIFNGDFPKMCSFLRLVNFVTFAFIIIISLLALGKNIWKRVNLLDRNSDNKSEAVP